VFLRVAYWSGGLCCIFCSHQGRYVYNRAANEYPDSDKTTAASNFPNKRGTATAFPLAALGLSAFFFSSMASVFFRSQVGPFLLLLADGTSVMVLVSGLFLRIIPPERDYTAVPARDAEDGSRFIIEQPQEIGRQRTISASSPLPSSSTQSHLTDTTASARLHRTSAELEEALDADEVSSLVSKPESLQYPHDHDGHAIYSHPSEQELGEIDSHYPDIRGFALLWKREFWQQFLMMALLSGIGLMTIK
jgi:hypothetical protein